MMELGYKKPLMEADLHQLEREHDAEVVTDRLETEWREELRRQGEDVQYAPSLGKAFVRTYWREYLAGVIPRLVKVVGSFVAPFLLQRLIQFVEDPSLSTLYGVVLLLVLFVSLNRPPRPQNRHPHFLILNSLTIFVPQFSNLVASVGLHRYWHVTVKTAMHVRASCIGIIYRKALRLGTIAKQSAGTGEVVNLMSNDSQRLQDTAFYLHFLWATPVLIILCFFLAAQVIGYIPTLAGYGVFVVMTPFSFIIARFLEKIRQTGLKVTDKRVKTTNEIFNAIKTIKLYTLEKVFFSRAEATRTEEIDIVRRYQLLKALNTCLNNALVPLISTVAFVVFVLRGGEITASVAFSTISLFNMLKWPFALFKDITTGLVEARVSLERLQAFLHSEEVPKQYVFPSTAQEIEGLGVDLDSAMDFQIHDPHISIRNGEFNWDVEGPHEQSTLSGVNLNISKGQLVCIVGPVGSGKTSLLNCILGEIAKVGGTVEVDGRICYAPQAPFLQHASVRENILFGKDVDEDFYDKVIDACGIGPDLDALLAGDQTLVRLARQSTTLA
jgi:ABC-type multidrug transport system fused ATPase/permease subunit